MRFRWANLLLLLLLASELVTGLLSYTSGPAGQKYFVDLHGIGGWAIVGVLVWKYQNILLALKSDRRLTASRLAFLLLLALLVTTMAAGILWTFTNPPRILGISVITWHVIMGVSLAPILLWHLVVRRRGLPSLSYTEGRRTFLRFSALGLAGLALWRVTDVVKGPLGVAGAARRHTGSYERGSFSGNQFPVTSWLFDNPAPVDVSAWKLRVDGAVEELLELTYDQLVQDAEITATLDCTGGWYSTQEWQGVDVSRLLTRARPMSEAESVTFWSTTGYYRRYSLADARSSLLATHVGGEKLAHSHGFPLRLVGPGKRGFNWVKWVHRIEVNTTSSWLQPPLPLQ